MKKKPVSLTQETLQDFLNTMPAVLYEYVLFTKEYSELLYMSPTSLDILGHPPDYFIADTQRLWTIVHPDDIDQLRAEDLKSVSGKDVFVSQVRVILPSGQLKWVLINSRPTLRKKHGATIWCGYITDISAQKSAEQEVALRTAQLLESETKLKHLNEALEKLAVQDGMTGIANRRAFDSRLEDEWNRCQREKHPLSLIMIDVDFFKQYNDHYGHLAGDDCLKMIAKALSCIAKRESDFCARFGGEEFVLLLPNTTLPAAQQMAEDCREKIYQLSIAHESSEACHVISISAGVSSTLASRNETPLSLIETADQALYQAKMNGRNRVESSHFSPSQVKHLTDCDH